MWTDLGETLQERDQDFTNRKLTDYARPAREQHAMRSSAVTLSAENSALGSQKLAAESLDRLEPWEPEEELMLG